MTNCYVNAIGNWKSTLHGRDEARSGLLRHPLHIAFNDAIIGHGPKQTPVQWCFPLRLGRGLCPILVDTGRGCDDVRVAMRDVPGSQHNAA